MIKASDVLATVLQLGRHNPNETRECRYVNDDGTPCCIVGVALIENGMDPQVFLDDEDLNRWNTVEELFSCYPRGLGLELDISATKLLALRDVQKRQDGGDSWGDAILALG